MLTAVIFLPLAAALVLLVLPRPADRAVKAVWVGVTAADLLLVLALWADRDPAGGFGHETTWRWMPSVGAAYHVGVDGMSLPLLGLACGLFLACALFSLPETDRVRGFAALFLFLQTVCLGLFAALDLILFFVFFDLSIVGMYFVIAGWGHGDRARSALMFFLYTFLGSLALLLGFIGLYLSAEPHTFDMAVLARQPPPGGLTGALVLLALGVGLAVKTPLFPFHTWLPPAHTDAPAAGSAILAGVLLKMGTYGFYRIAMPLLPETWRRYAWVFVVAGVVSVLYGALVALAQENVKRMIAYTSVNHMGYVVLAAGAAGVLAGDGDARSLAVTGGITQMVSHGLITGALFLLTGVLHRRSGTYQLAEYGALAGRAPRFAALFAVAAFAALGLPGLSGFIAEFQVFTGSIATVPVAGAIALLGILVTAGLFLRALHRLLLDSPPGAGTVRFTDVGGSELSAVVPLLLLSVLVGVAPRFLLDVIEPAGSTLVALVAR